MPSEDKNDKNYYYMFPWYKNSLRSSSPGSVLMDMMVEEISQTRELYYLHETKTISTRSV